MPGFSGRVEICDTIITYKVNEWVADQEKVNDSAKAYIEGKPNPHTDTVDYTVEYEEDGEKKVEEVFGADAQSFMKALCISLHYDGAPDYKVDYPDAEKIAALTKHRWIP